MNFIKTLFFIISLKKIKQKRTKYSIYNSLTNKSNDVLQITAWNLLATTF